MVIRAGPLLVRRLVIDYPEGGHDLPSFADLTGEMVSFGEEGIADPPVPLDFWVYTPALRLPASIQKTADSGVRPIHARSQNQFPSSSPNPFGRHALRMMH